MTTKSLISALEAKIAQQALSRTIDIQMIEQLFKDHRIGEKELASCLTLVANLKHSRHFSSRFPSDYSDYQCALLLAYKEVLNTARLLRVKNILRFNNPQMAFIFSELSDFFDRRLPVLAEEDMLSEVAKITERVVSFLYGVLSYEKVSAELIRLLQRMPHIGSTTRPLRICSLGCGAASLLPLYVYLLEEDPRLIRLRGNKPLVFRYLGVDVDEVVLQSAEELYRSIRRNPASNNALFTFFVKVDANDPEALLKAMDQKGMDITLGFDWVSMLHPNSGPADGKVENPFRKMMRVAVPFLSNPTAVFYACSYVITELAALFANVKGGIDDYGMDFPGLLGARAGGFFAQNDREGIEALAEIVKPRQMSDAPISLDAFDGETIRRFLGYRNIYCPIVPAQNHPGFPDGYQHPVRGQLSVGASGVALNADLLRANPVKRMHAVCSKLYFNRFFDDAVVALIEFITYYPDFDENRGDKSALNFILARCYMQQNNFSLAISALDEAMTCLPERYAKTLSYYQATRAEAEVLQAFHQNSEYPAITLPQLRGAYRQLQAHKQDPARLAQLRVAIEVAEKPAIAKVAGASVKRLVELKFGEGANEEKPGGCLKKCCR